VVTAWQEVAEAIGYMPAEDMGFDLVDDMKIVVIGNTQAEVMVVDLDNTQTAVPGNGRQDVVIGFDSVEGVHRDSVEVGDLQVEEGVGLDLVVMD
jgi:tricorn protease-like protein